MYVYCFYPVIWKTPKHSWNKRRSNSFQWRHLWRHRLYCYRFIRCTWIRYKKCFIRPM